MCDHKDNPGLPLTFDQFAEFLREPPFEPCESELQFLSPVEYQRVFVEAMQRYYYKVMGHIAHIIKDRDRAADLTQEVFINLLKARSSFDAAYIYRAAKNRAFNDLRQTLRRRVVETRWAGINMRYERKGLHEFEAADTRPPQDAELFERARAEATRNAVDRLPEKFREPLVLFAAGKSYKQIIRITGLNMGTVKSRICRGKSLLRRRLRAYL
jgi:RNA polymerase sigma-70 factor (ECF subfamily)